MRKRFLITLIILVAAVAVLAAWRQFPLASSVFRPTVLTTEDTTLTIPANYRARSTVIVNDGTGRCYFRFGAGPVNTATDMYVEPNEALPELDVPWNTMQLRAETASATMRIFVSY